MFCLLSHQYLGITERDIRHIATDWATVRIKPADYLHRSLCRGLIFRFHLRRMIRRMDYIDPSALHAMLNSRPGVAEKFSGAGMALRNMRVWRYIEEVARI